jgi:uncharacterized protein (DUF1499 family)
MRALALLLGLLLPGCRGTGAEGLPPPAPLDMTRLVRPASPNTALAAPAGFVPAPDVVTRRYDATPERLFAAVQSVALSRPRTFAHAVFPDRRQAHFVVRSRLVNFPDLVAVQVTPESELILWSRSVYGRSDFGVNRRRLEEWLVALDSALLSP